MHDESNGPHPTELLTSFLTHKTRHTKPSPKRQSEGQTHIHWSTLNDWVQLLVGLTRTHAKSVANDIAPRLAQHRGFLSEQLDLERHIGDKLYFGRGETQLLLEHLLGKGEEPEWTLQCYVNWLIMFLTGARPSALGPYYPAWVKQGKFLKLKDFRIYVEGPATWRIELFFRVIKGFNKDKEGKTVKIICRPTQMWENVVFDLGPPLLSLLLKRGALADISTLEELLAYDKTEIHIRSEHLEQPLFYAGISKGAGVSRTPQGPGSMSAVIKRHCMDVGFVGGSSYPFRRAGAQTIHDQYGLSATKGYLSHQPNTNTAENSYLLGSATLDVVGANTGEALISTNDLNMFTAPSLGPGAGLRPDAQARLDRLTTGHKPFRSCDPAQQETHRRTEETRKLKDGTRIPLSVFISYMKRARRDPDYLAYVQSEACAATEREMVQLKADVEDMVGKVQSGGSATNVPGRIASSKATRAQKDTATENWKKYTKLQTQVVSRRTSKAVKVLQRLYYLDHPKDVADTNTTPIATVSSSSGPVTSSTGKPLQTIAEFEERRKKRAAPSQLAQAAVDLASKTSGSGLPEHDEEQPLADLHMGDLIDMGSDMPPFALSRDVNGRLELCRDAALEEPGAKIDEDTSKDMSAVRAGYVRLLMSLKKADNTNELRCELCPIDPTAEAARLGETYNARGLLRHHNGERHLKKYALNVMPSTRILLTMSAFPGSKPHKDTPFISSVLILVTLMSLIMPWIHASMTLIGRVSYKNIVL
ncbi:hypothetical protein EUX98_g9499 [Antrodiella citrinella]|uniref:Uncharacterized protein n=1 Tax=Antrodiella citrinella TaxID=2447956 RepID=A0A4S4LXY1_9APHY|nr:hypothetical protein EUX98_g9499 [Antrodiella citrinella]